MRTLSLAAMLFASLLRTCGGEDEEPPPAAAPPTTVAVEATAPSAEVTVAARAPRHGGSVVMAEDYAVEVVPRPSGEVVAYVVDAEGSVPPPAEVNLMVNVWGADAHVHPVAMVWDPVELHFEGHLVGIAPAPGPAEVVVVAGGRPHRGRLHAVAIVPVAEVHAGVAVHTPGVVVAAPHAHVHGAVEVVAPRPHLDVQVFAPPPPSIDVHIGAPAVHVEGPSRGVILVGPGAPGRRVGHYRGHGHGHFSGHAGFRVRHH